MEISTTVEFYKVLRMGGRIKIWRERDIRLSAEVVPGMTNI